MTHTLKRLPSVQTLRTQTVSNGNCAAEVVRHGSGLPLKRTYRGFLLDGAAERCLLNTSMMCTLPYRHNRRSHGLHETPVKETKMHAMQTPQLRLMTLLARMI